VALGKQVCLRWPAGKVPEWPTTSCIILLYCSIYSKISPSHCSLICCLPEAGVLACLPCNGHDGDSPHVSGEAFHAAMTVHHHRFTEQNCVKIFLASSQRQQ
jgi:hypothetical protein